MQAMPQPVLQPPCTVVTGECTPTFVGALVGAFVGSPMMFVRASAVFTLMGTLVGAFVGACSRQPGQTAHPLLSMCRNMAMVTDARRTPQAASFDTFQARPTFVGAFVGSFVGTPPMRAAVATFVGALAGAFRSTFTGAFVGALVGTFALVGTLMGACRRDQSKLGVRYTRGAMLTTHIHTHASLATFGPFSDGDCRRLWTLLLMAMRHTQACQF